MPRFYKRGAFRGRFRQQFTNNLLIRKYYGQFFLYLRFGFVFFGQKEVGKPFACNILLKLTTEEHLNLLFKIRFALFIENKVGTILSKVWRDELWPLLPKLLLEIPTFCSNKFNGNKSTTLCCKIGLKLVRSTGG